MAQNAFSVAYSISCNSYVDKNHQPHIFNKGHYQKENNMEEQMEQVWRSKDGKVTGSKEEVEAYLKSKNPLAGMHFPYYYSPGAGIMTEYKPGYGAPTELEEKNAVVAFANLAPLIEELRQAWENYWGSEWRTRWHADKSMSGAKVLLLAYEEALKQVPQ